VFCSPKGFCCPPPPCPSHPWNGNRGPRATKTKRKTGRRLKGGNGNPVPTLIAAAQHMSSTSNIAMFYASIFGSCLLQVFIIYRLKKKKRTRRRNLPKDFADDFYASRPRAPGTFVLSHWIAGTPKVSGGLLGHAQKSRQSWIQMGWLHSRGPQRGAGTRPEPDVVCSLLLAWCFRIMHVRCLGF